MRLTDREMVRLGELLDEALVLTPEQRRAWLDSLSDGDQPLVRTLRDTLLTEATGASGPLDRPPRIDTESGEEAVTRHAGEQLGAYELLRPLGFGGMAEVWLACRKDGAFDRQVALKIPRLRGRPIEMTARFALECNLLAALEYPGIARLYDAGVDVGGWPYIAMEYVQGEPLVAWCNARGLDAVARIQVFLQVLDAVAYAHGHQVIHRDLKPSNILVTEQGQVRLLDFGVARLLQPETDGVSLTRAYGLAVTPEYASPELLRRDPIDLRSDIYSLGVVLHELLTGVRPAASGESAGNLGAGLREVVMKALRPNPGDRHPDAASFAAALRPFLDANAHEQSRRPKVRYLWAAVLAVFVMGAVGAGLYVFRPEIVTEQPQVRSLAVLPLQSVDPNDHALGFGIADAVIRRISQTGAMTVRPASSVRHYLDKETDAKTAAKELAVDTVLEGTVQRVGGHVRIGVSLSRADGTLLWTESFDTQTTDVFAAQDTIAQQVASQLQLHLTHDQQTRLSKRSTSNPLAYDYYTRAVFSYDLRGRGRGAVEQSETTMDLFKRAIAADPNYALAHARLAHAYAFHGLFNSPAEQEKWLSLATDEIKRADAIDAQLPETHLARATVLYSDVQGYQAAAAIREARAAQRLNPNLGQHELAEFYNHVGLDELAQRQYQRAFEIDPTSEILAGDYCSWHLLLHRPDEFAAAMRKYFPEAPLPFQYYMMKGDLETAQQVIDEAAVGGGNDCVFLMRGFLLAVKGDRKGSEEAVAKFIAAMPPDSRRANNHYHLTYDIAAVYALNGNGPEAMKWLRESAALGFRSYTLFARDPFLDNIRQLPEFGRFIAEIKAEYDGLRNEFG